MKEIDRREFMKTVATGGAMLVTAESLLHKRLEAAPSAGQVEVLYLGHSTFRITSTTGKVIVIDPFLTKNPRTPTKYKDLKALGKVDLISSRTVTATILPTCPNWRKSQAPRWSAITSWRSIWCPWASSMARRPSS
ncbi:MAG: twin-arginine translocation signal domain-containing protein [Thermodesulfobacteriota bacterium]